MASVLDNIGNAIDKAVKDTAGVYERNRGAIGSGLKDIAPLAALIPGVGIPLAAGLAAGGAGLGEAITPGSNAGDILKSAGIGGVEGGAAAALGAAGAAANAPAPEEDLTAGSIGGGVAPVAQAAAPATSVGGQGSNILSGLEKFGSGAVNLADKHPALAAAGLQGIAQNFGPQGQLAQAEADQAKYQLAQMQGRDTALNPLRQMLEAQLGSQYGAGYGPNLIRPTRTY